MGAGESSLVTLHDAAKHLSSTAVALDDAIWQRLFSVRSPGTAVCIAPSVFHSFRRVMRYLSCMVQVTPSKDEVWWALAADTLRAIKEKQPQNFTHLLHHVQS